MKQGLAVLIRARSSLVCAAVVCVACLLLVLQGRNASVNAWSEAARAQGALEAQRSEVRERQADLLALRQQIQAYRQLQRQGLFAAERALWVEQFVASHQRLGLPGPLHYTLKAPRPLTQAGVAPPPGTPASAQSVDVTQTHDLEFSLKGVHEQDLLALLQDFEVHASGPWRMQACELREPTPRGLTVQCVLRFFTLPGAGAPVLPELAAPAPTSPARTGAPPLATLMYSPAERAALERERQGVLGADAATRLHLEGIVQRARGKSTAWINHQALEQGQGWPGLRRSTIAADAVTLDGRRLRVGETLDLSTGQRSDSIAPGSVLLKELP